MPRYNILLPAALLLSLAALLGHRLDAPHISPPDIAAIITRDIAHREADALQAIEDHKQETIQWLQRSGSVSAADWLAQTSFYLYAYRADSLIAWSSSDVLPVSALPGRGRLCVLRSGDYYGCTLKPDWLPAGISLSLLLPIRIQYPLTNEYLQPRFAASSKLDLRTTIADSSGADAAVLHAPGGRAIGYVHSGHGETAPRLPAWWVVMLWATSLLMLAGWIHITACKLAKRQRTAGVVLIIAFIMLLRGAMYGLGLPFSLGNTELFSPGIYASSELLPSLGDLLLNTLAVAWVLGFVLHCWPAHLLRSSRIMRQHALMQWVSGIVCGVALSGASLVYLRLVRSLIVDSLIPFDNAHLSALDGVALAGLFASGLLTACLLMSAAVLRRMLATFSSIAVQVVTLALGYGLMVTTIAPLATAPYSGLLHCLMLWLTLCIAVQQHEPRRERGAGFRAANFFWAIAHSTLLTFLLIHFTGIREGALRHTFAEHIATRHDDALEYAFGQVVPQLERDTAVLQFFRNPPNAKSRAALEERLSKIYFNNAFPAYQAHIYLYGSDGQPRMNADSATLSKFSSIAADAVPSRTAYHLYYREGMVNDHIYLGFVDLRDSAVAVGPQAVNGNNGEDREVIGTIVLDLEQKKIVAETVLPELLQPATVNRAEKAAGYSYAVYADRKLVAQTSDYPFAFYIAPDTTGKEYHERQGKDFAMLIYTPDAHRTVYVWHRLSKRAEAVTIFSYLLALRFLIIALIALTGLLGAAFANKEKRRKLIAGMGLRRRVQLSVTGIVLFSFLTIGVLTVSFLRYQYAANSKAARQAMMQAVSRAIQQWMREHSGAGNVADWRSLMGSGEARSFLTTLAAAQKIDINLFDASGRLAQTTQPAIYDNGLLAPLMRPGVLHEMYTAPRPLIMQDEQIGSLGYVSCYTPLRDEGAGIAGFLNVPLFYSQRALDEQVSGVVVALINLYVATFLLSSLLALLISGWLTRAFDMIIRQFGRLSLRGNELLRWPYDDEIGLLVAEYNKMVRKVEESAALLARSEREEAWREMARQVAHEIKNPLTPMKLQIQYLQRAIGEGRADALPMAGRVSESLLEQIDNLSTIATEFGDFARIGSQAPAEIDLADVLRNVAELYIHEDTSTMVHYDIPATPVQVMADRSQIVRIITNLMQNAVQAIPEGRAGHIEVRLKVINANRRDEAVITVSDNGSGISTEAQERLFTPYFTTKTSGTGLGLAMTRQMVEVWGGSISYETAEALGTTFTIRLPVLGAGAIISP